MSEASNSSPWSGAVSDLLTQASAVLTREGARLYGGSRDGFGYPGVPAVPGISAIPAIPAMPGIPAVPDGGETLIGIASRICPVTGAAMPLSPPDQGRLRQQAHELVAGLLGGTGGGDADRLRRQAHELIESLLARFTGGTSEKGRAGEDQVPLLRCAAPVQAGHEARFGFRVTNEEDTPSEVTLYCTDFISDSGHEIPALRIAVLPRRASLPAKGDTEFQIKIAVPQQTPAGCYSGLIQAMGNRYVKAVLMVEVI
jgi:hypothetical protein